MASHDTIGSAIWISYPGQFFFFFFLKKASWQSGVLLRKRASESTTLDPNRNTRVVKCFPPLSDRWVLCLRMGDGPWEVKTSEHHLAPAGTLLQSLIRLLLLIPEKHSGNLISPEDTSTWKKWLWMIFLKEEMEFFLILHRLRCYDKRTWSL